MKQLQFSLSAKITIVFTIIIFAFVLGFSSLMIAMTQRSLETQRSNDLRQALELLEDAVASSNENDIRVRADAFPYYVLYKIILSDGTTLRTNDAVIPQIDEPSTERASRYFVKDFFTDGDLNLLYMTKSISKQNASDEEASYQIQVALDLSNDAITLMLERMPFIFMMFALPLLVVSAVLGYFVCTRLLKPIKKITHQAQEISGEHLDSRLDENGAHDELRELAHTFNNLFARLEKDFEKQKQFTSDAAHELKTPIAVISGYVDILSRWGKDDAKVLNDSLAVLKRESASMTTLVENLLALSRAENSAQIKYEKNTLQVKNFLEQIRDDFAIVSPSTKFTIMCDENAVIQTNEDALRELLRIFIRNSIAYSEPPADVTLEFCDGISASGAAERRAVANASTHSESTATGKCLVVRDKGVGISPENLPKIFDRFYRVDESRNRATGGNGLGLSIAKAVAQKLDVTLSAESEVGKGTAIKINFV